MAEINIQRKKRPIWPWILGLLLIAAIVVFILYTTDVERGENFDSPAIVDTVEQDVYGNDYNTSSEDKVAKFVLFIRDSSSEAFNNGNGDQYTEKGLILLNDAIKDVAAKDTVNKIKTDSVDNFSEGFDRNKDSVKYIASIKKAFINSAEVISDLEKNKRGEDNKTEGEELKKIAVSLKTNKSLSDQENIIKNYFEKSGTILQQLTAMNYTDK